MKSNGYPLLRIAGVQFWTGRSAPFVVVSAFLSLRFGLFPFWYDQLSPAQYWWMAMITTVALIVSWVLHNLAHVLTARYYGEAQSTIQLALFGGVDLVGHEPANSRVEARVAEAGPFASAALGMLLFALCLLLERRGYSQPTVGILFHVAAANLTLALLNFLPFFPFDTGRVVQLWIWRWRRDFTVANYLASRGGVLAAVVALAIGLYQGATGHALIAAWTVAFGLGLLYAINTIREDLMIRTVLDQYSIREAMSSSPYSVSPTTPLVDFLSSTRQEAADSLSPVVSAQRFLGTVSKRSAKGISNEEKGKLRVSSVMTPAALCDARLGSNVPASTVYRRLRGPGPELYFILEGDTFLGTASVDGLRNFVFEKLETARRIK